MEIVLDVWEGDANLDAAVLKANGVAGVICRINDMDGGHHPDAAFPGLWDLAKQFDGRAVYFVYNPWVDGAANYTWLENNLPADFAEHRVMVDIEVKMPGYAPATYAAEVQRFLLLAAVRHNVSIYTGGWFLGVLSAWPKNVGYWWARYPLKFYPTGRIEVSWAALRAMIAESYYVPDSYKVCPGPVELWQFTADRLILPGFGGRAVDLNWWPGRRAELVTWMNGTAAPAAEPTDAEKQDILWREAGLRGWNLQK